MSKKIIFSILAFAIIIGGLLYFRAQVYFSHGPTKENKVFEIAKGEGNAQIATNLKKEGMISGTWYFYYYMRTHGLLNNVLPGKFSLNGNMTIPEIANYITNEENILPGYVKATFPEGWDMKRMAEKLNSGGLDGNGFLRMAQNPSKDITGSYGFMPASGKSLEGYLFPDTYFFKKDIDAKGIIIKILDNFDKKLTSQMRDDIKKQEKTIPEIITLASIVEKEVSSDEDRALVSGLFWNRIKIGQALQSDATLSYILGDKNDQHSLDETRIDSPYNTYRNRGLTPGPISNPGLSSIRAAIYPKDSDYNYFLSDPATGDTIFSRTFEEHIANRNKYGL